MEANAAAFINSLTAWDNAIAAFKAQYPNTPVATTEPVADYLLQAAGADNLTPFAFQADIMNGTDPSAQDVAIERSLLPVIRGCSACTARGVKAFDTSRRRRV